MINTKEIEYMQALAEVSYILKYTDLELVKKIPTKFLEHIENKKDKNYIVNIDNKISLEEQVLKEKTKDLMGIIYRNYFCLPEEKEEYDKLLKENQDKYNQELREKYNPDNLFNKNKKEEKKKEYIEENNEQVALIDYKNMKWYKKVIFKITNWFKVIMSKDKV